MIRTLTNAACCLSCALAACTTAPKSEAGKTDIRERASATLATAERNDPTLSPVLRAAKGYAVFPTIGKGVLYEGGVFSGYCDLSQGSVGFQLGGQAYSEIICFATADALTLFKTGNFAFDAQATAVALKSGAGANAKYSNGVTVFTMDESGLMFEASVGGQKFTYQAR
jgi:lipid-binding SYLF domain-containing protein